MTSGPGHPDPGAAAMHAKAAPRAWTATLRAPHRALPAFEAAFGAAESLSIDVDTGGPCRLRAVFGGRADRVAVEAAVAIAAAACGTAPPPVAWAPLADRDWVAEGLAALAPVRAGRFRVRGGHHAAWPSLYELRVEAAAAFGTGHHETTRGCLLALDRLARRRRFARPLDMGCGSGVLALAMARLWRRRVLAVDIDPAAVAQTRANARRNRLARLAVCREGRGFAALRRGERCDVAAANILAGPLAAMAPALAARLAPGGIAILSGLLRAQAAPLLIACRRHGLVLRERVDLGEWPTLRLAKARRGRWLGDLDSNQDRSGQSRKFYR